MRRLIAVAVLLCTVLSAAAAQQDEDTFALASLFGDNMVLQRDSYVPVWGWAEPGGKISVSVSWSKKKYTCTATDGGEWLVAIESPSAGGPYSMTVTADEPSRKGTSSIEINDILSGEVWICSGQSNMEIPLRGFGFQYVEGAKEAILEAGAYADRIRIFKVAEDTSYVRQEDVDAVWKKSSPSTAADCSAVAYFFARRLTAALNVPVGIIFNAWGGSKIEPWMPQESIAEAVSGETYDKIMARKNRQWGYPEAVGTCYNSRIYPLREFAARGFLWYQGCSNVGDDEYYDRLMAAMVSRWREDWSDTEARMPFMFVTIAPNDYSGSDGLERPLLVENQLKALAKIPNSYAAISETYGQEHCIHPPYKQEIADQLVMYALAEVYGIDLGINYKPAYPESFTYGEGECEILFGGAWNGLGQCTEREIFGFELAGQDKVFHKATAYMKDDGQTVHVDCPEVPAPVAVRYSFRNYIYSNLRNTFGVPVAPFRTDNW